VAKLRVLSLDGGGTHAGVLARALGAIYGDGVPGRKILGNFQVVAGNSGGSIVMTALCCDYTPQEIAGFYNDPATLVRLFSPRWVDRRLWLRKVLPRYSSSGKFAALKEIFDAKPLPGGKVPSSVAIEQWPALLGRDDLQLLVTAYDYDRNRAAFFRSNLNSRARGSAAPLRATLVEAVHASTNPPIVFYDRPADVGENRYWDGGIAGYDNPVLAAVIEALANRTDPADEIVVLSIGTHSSVRPIMIGGIPVAPLGEPRSRPCLVSDALKAGKAVLQDPPDVATFHAYMTLGQPLPPLLLDPSATAIVRACPQMSPVWNRQASAWELPRGLTMREFDALYEMPLDPKSRGEIDLIWKMGDLWLGDRLPNQPIRAGDHLECDIGDPVFSDARAHWLKISV